MRNTEDKLNKIIVETMNVVIEFLVNIIDQQNKYTE